MSGVIFKVRFLGYWLGSDVVMYSKSASQCTILDLLPPLCTFVEIQTISRSLVEGCLFVLTAGPEFIVQMVLTVLTAHGQLGVQMR